MFCAAATVGVRHSTFFASLELRRGTGTTFCFLVYCSGGGTGNTISVNGLASALEKDVGLVGMTPAWRPSVADPRDKFTHVESCGARKEICSY
jgi:hypothetical protein